MKTVRKIKSKTKTWKRKADIPGWGICTIKEDESGSVEGYKKNRRLGYCGSSFALEHLVLSNEEKKEIRKLEQECKEFESLREEIRKAFDDEYMNIKRKMRDKLNKIVGREE